MKKIIDKKQFKIYQAEENDFDKWIKKEFRECHPINLVEKTFPKPVMDIICSDHYKSKDGGFVISYDYFNKKWYVSHPGYVREIEAEGNTFTEAARKYLEILERENSKVLYSGIKQEVNKRLPKNLSVEIGENDITVLEFIKGQDELRCIATFEIKNKTIDEIVDKVNEILNDYKVLL